MAKRSKFRHFLLLLPSLSVGFLLLFSRIDPRLHWLPATANPLVPGLLLVLLFLLLWQFYRQRYLAATLSFFILFLAWPLVRQTLAWASPAASSATEKQIFSLATANVYSFLMPRQKNAPLDSTAIKAFVDRLSADVLALQEYDYSSKNWRSGLIAKHGRLPYIRKARDGGALVVFSRWPIQVVEEKLLGNSVNGYQVMDISHPAGTFRLVNMHLKSNQITHIAEELQRQKSSSQQKKDQLLRMFSRYGRASAIRAEQATLIARLLTESPHPLIVVGDMNEVPTSYPYRLIMKNKGLQDAWLVAGRGIGATFAGNLPGLRIDYILPDTALQVKAVQVLPEGYGDHRPLKAQLQFRRPQK